MPAERAQPTSSGVSERRKVAVLDCAQPPEAATAAGVADPAEIRASSATTGGTAKHQFAILLNSRAAIAAPPAKLATAIDIRRSRARAASRASGESPRIVSATSIMICVVVPVMIVVGGDEPMWIR